MFLLLNAKLNVALFISSFSFNSKSNDFSTITHKHISSGQIFHFSYYLCILVHVFHEKPNKNQLLLYIFQWNCLTSHKKMKVRELRRIKRKHINVETFIVFMFVELKWIKHVRNGMGEHEIWNKEHNI